MFAQDRQIAFTSFKEATAYKFSMLFSLVTGPLVVLTNYIIWKAVFETSGKTIIGGYTFEQMLTHIVIGIVTFFLLWDNVDQVLDKAVESGSLVAYLLKPVDFWRYEFAVKLGHRVLAFLIEFVPVIFICGLLVGFNVYTGGS